jgi:hypothetical protein
MTTDPAACALDCVQPGETTVEAAVEVGTAVDVVPPPDAVTPGAKACSSFGS